MADVTPLFLTAQSLPALLTFILSKKAQQTTLIICSSQSAFLRELHTSLPEDSIFLKTTLSTLADTRTVQIAYVPTLPHLRAFLSVYKPPPPESLCSNRTSTKAPLLVILNLVDLHENTTSLAAQGIGLTIASAVEVAARENMKLLAVEYAENGDQIWTKQLPVLNGNGIAFAGRTIELRKVFARWCNYGGIIKEDEDEMGSI